MKNCQTRKHRPGFVLIATASAALLLGTSCRAGSEAAQTNSVAPPANAGQQPKSNAKPSKVRTATRQLSGAELYSMHCNRCHPERYPTERTAAQWKTIMLHMRVRANLPGEQARTILRYLQDNSGR